MLCFPFLPRTTSCMWSIINVGRLMNSNLLNFIKYKFEAMFHFSYLGKTTLFKKSKTKWRSLLSYFLFTTLTDFPLTIAAVAKNYIGSCYIETVPTPQIRTSRILPSKTISILSFFT